MTVHSLPLAVVDEQQRRTWSGRAQAILILLVCMAPVVASYWVFYVARPDGSGAAYGTLIQPTVAIPDVTATDLQGASVSLRSLKGQWLLVTVGPATCNAVCEQRLLLQRQLREMLGRERERVDKVWLITDDTAPSPALQQALAATPPVTALRLPRAVVQGWLKPAAGHALEEHLYIVDPMGEWMMRVPTSPDPAKVRRDLERLLRASAAWDLPGRGS
ncbi:MAG TPA: SCO family protein [Burkholderiaceae bacterium]|nr:SCO family protein [Burkholderiaceae bacterium]